MSDNWITLVPEDPHFVPDEARQLRARDRFAEIAPNSDSIEIQTSETVQFFDCGANLERISCASCGAEIPMDWSEERMEADFDDGFKLASYRVPCCGVQSTLHALHYDWPQSFGRFAIDAMNPNLGKIEEADKKELEVILGTKLIVVYQHI